MLCEFLLPVCAMLFVFRETMTPAQREEILHPSNESVRKHFSLTSSVCVVKSGIFQNFSSTYRIKRRSTGYTTLSNPDVTLTRHNSTSRHSSADFSNFGPVRLLSHDSLSSTSDDVIIVHQTLEAAIQGRETNISDVATGGSCDDGREKSERHEMVSSEGNHSSSN